MEEEEEVIIEILIETPRQEATITTITAGGAAIAITLTTTLTTEITTVVTIAIIECTQGDE